MIIIPVLLLIAALLAVVWLFSLSPDYRVTRTVDIGCQASAAFDQVADLRSWRLWSPWMIHEPDCSLRFSDDPGSIGGSYEWDGKFIGAGKMTHLRFERPAAIDQSLEFRRPFRMRSEVEWRFDEEKERGVTTVSWTLVGRMPFFFRWMAKKMDRQIGPDYELGLILLRALLDESADQLKISFGDRRQRPPQSCLTAPARGSLEEIKQAMSDTFPKLVAAAGDSANGRPFTCYHKVRKGRFEIDMAIPVKAGTVAAVPFAIKEFAGGRYFTVTQQGSYDFLAQTWHSAMMHLRLKKIGYDRRPAFEVYENDPGATAASDLTTVLYLPVKG